MWKLLSQQQNFVAATSRTKSSQTELVQLDAATKFPSSHEAICPSNVSCNFWSNLSADLYTQTDLSLRPVAAHVAQCVPTLSNCSGIKCDLLFRSLRWIVDFKTRWEHLPQTHFHHLECFLPPPSITYDYVSN